MSSAAGRGRHVDAGDLVAAYRPAAHDIVCRRAGGLGAPPPCPTTTASTLYRNFRKCAVRTGSSFVVDVVLRGEPKPLCRRTGRSGNRKQRR